MKRRALALLLALCMIVPTLACAPLAAAEELTAISESLDALQEAPSGEAGDIALFEEELPPAIEAEPTGDAPLPGDEASGGDELTPEEEVPAEELPAEDAAQAQPVYAGGYTDVNTDIDSIAYGSAEVPYAGVAYISRASYESLDADAQAAYDDMADQINGLLDDGVAVEDVVFSVRADGSVSANFKLPLLRFWEEAEEVPSEALAEVEVPAEAFAAVEAPAEEAAEAQGEPAPEEAAAAQDEAQGDEAEAPREIIESNVELAEQVHVPIERIPGKPQEEADSSLAGDQFGLESFGKLFTETEDFFSRQLYSTGKTLFDCGYKSMVQGNYTGFTIRGLSSLAVVDITSAFSALLNTYPAETDWVDRGPNSSIEDEITYTGGAYNVSLSLPVSEHYTNGLEKQARAVVQDVVDAAALFAEQEFPDNPVLGMALYFDIWVCDHCYYNSVGTSEVASVQASADYYYCHTSYGALLKGFGVCESYATAMARLLNAAGIPNLLVTGAVPGGPHAWNYVRMPDGLYYLLDSTWNDDKSTGESNFGYFLVPNDGQHLAHGCRFGSGYAFNFPSLNNTFYDPYATTVTLNERVLYLAKGKSATLSLGSGDWKVEGVKKSWSSSNKSVATVSSKGKVTAKKPGTAIITMRAGNYTAQCTVYVYQFSNIKFRDNKKSSYSVTLDLDEGYQTFFLDVGFSAKECTVADLVSQGVIAAPTVTSSNESVVIADVAEPKGNTLTLAVGLKRVGKSTISVKIGGKTAKLTVTVRRMLRSDWFNLEYNSTPYTGKALKPKVWLTSSAPDGLTYKVSYSRNTNAGTATVKITGTGNYGGTVSKGFNIEYASLNGASISISKNKKTYNGKVQRPSVTLKLNKKTLKQGKDYKVRYCYTAADGTGYYTYDPKNAHVYTVVIEAIGNYDGLYSGTNSPLLYTIERCPESKLKISMKKSVSYNGSRVTSSRLGFKVKIGSTTLKEGDDYDVVYSSDSNAQNLIQAPYARGTYYVWAAIYDDNIITNVSEGKIRIKGSSFKIK